jgi:hypothetical protein
MDDCKSEKLEATFHELLSLSLLGPSNFCFSKKLIHKRDEKLKQITPPLQILGCDCVPEFETKKM